MKSKLLSLLLVITLLAITVSVGLPTTLAADENLLTNGDFSDYSGYTPDGWKVSLKSAGGASAEIVENVEIADGVKANALKVTTTKDDTGRHHLNYGSTVKIERNAAYTMSFWVRVSKITGFRAYMFEPTYITKDGSSETSDVAQEGGNIYSYSHDNGTSRVIRTDVKHSWKIAETGVAIDNSTVSMFITRSKGTNQVLTPDYPSTAREGEWMQIIHTFETGNDVAHEADVSYDFQFPSAVGGEVWISDIKMRVVKSEIDTYYAPAVNDDKLGCISPYGEQPLYAGKEVTYTAEPFGENTFDGWYADGELVSEDPVLTFVHDPAATYNYEARFTKADFGIDGSYESSANGLVAQATYGTVAEWSDTAFIDSSKDNLHYIDSHNTGIWRKATVTTEMAHSGSKSLLYSGQYGSIGRKFTGLQKNSEYIVSVYAYTISPVDSTGKDTNVKGVGTRRVTTTDKSYIKLNGTKLTPKDVGEDGLIDKYWESTDTLEKWTKISYQFNTGDNTEIIFWMEGSGYEAKLYLDDYSIARAPYNFKPLVNDANLGFVSPAEGAEAVQGQDVTVTAQPLDGNIFDGWYIGDEKVSDKSEYTFQFTPEAVNLTAHFTAGATAVPNAGFETGYTDGQLLAQISHQKSIKPSDKLSDEEKANYKTDWTEESFLSTNKDGSDMYYMESQYAGDYRKVTVTVAKAHTGKYSLLFNGSYGYFGKKFTGLEKNTEYAISYYYFIEDAAASLTPFIVTAADESCMKADAKPKTATEVLGKVDTKCNPSENWEKFTVSFNSGENTEVILWTYHGGTGNVYLDNFALYKPVSASVAAGLGGDYSTNLSATSIPYGTKVEVSATPLEGNTFAGWFDGADKLVSSEANYSFNATEDFILVAKFDGYNKPTRDVLAAQGMDGTFETGTVNGWYADDPTYGDSVTWCTYVKSDMMAYEGSYSFKSVARHRNSILPLNGLMKNADYKLVMYVNLPDPHQTAKIDSLGVIGPNDSHLASASVVLAKLSRVNANSGWHKVELYFNSGDNTSARFILRYSTDETSDGVASVFYDNIALYQYEAADELVNGDFENGKTNWVGEGTAATDGDANVLSLAEGETVYQGIDVSAYQSYTVSFRAKGNVTAAAQDLAKYDINVKDYITSRSYVQASGEEWKEYSYTFNTGSDKALNLVFGAGESGAMIDDVKITANVENAGTVLEHIDFETERFEYAATADSPYSIYYAEGESDPNVKSGSKSLKFTYSNQTTADYYFDEAFVAFQPGASINYKISISYKLVSGKQGGTIRLAPEYSGTYGAEDGFEHMAENNGWQVINFYVNNTTHASFKTMIANIAGGTECDFYIDDIIISVAPPMVIEENAKITYCERLYNVVDNESFENKLTKDDWANTTSTMKVIKGDALKGSYFLRASAGTEYVLELDVLPETEYYFAASLRGTAKTKGYIGLSTDAEGEKLYVNRAEEPASIVTAKTGESGWSRSGFRLTTDGTGKAYLVINVTEGYLDIDSVMMFTADYGYRYDPNDYFIYVPYDYDNLKSATTVINGGFGPQPYYKGTDLGAEGGTPDTGDSMAAPIAIVLVVTGAFAALLLAKKRKEGANADA